jgi:hypothetical protein
MGRRTGLRFRAVARMFSSTMSTPALRFAQPPIQWLLGEGFPSDAGDRRKDDGSPPSSSGSRRHVKLCRH